MLKRNRIMKKITNWYYLVCVRFAMCFPDVYEIGMSQCYYRLYERCKIFVRIPVSSYTTLRTTRFDCSQNVHLYLTLCAFAVGAADSKIVPCYHYFTWNNNNMEPTITSIILFSTVNGNSNK